MEEGEVSGEQQSLGKMMENKMGIQLESMNRVWVIRNEKGSVDPIELWERRGFLPNITDARESQAILLATL